jgi:hypothetical protein
MFSESLESDIRAAIAAFLASMALARPIYIAASSSSSKGWFFSKSLMS